MAPPDDDIHLPSVNLRLERFEERNGFLRAVLGLACFARRAEAVLMGATRTAAKVADEREIDDWPELFVLLGVVALLGPLRNEIDGMCAEGASGRIAPPRDEHPLAGGLLR